MNSYAYNLQKARQSEVHKTFYGQNRFRVKVTEAKYQRIAKLAKYEIRATGSLNGPVS